MSEAYSDFDSRKPIAMEQEIDRLVYELYELTPEEIAIVEATK